VVPFPAEDGSDEDVSEFENVAREDRRWVQRESFLAGSSGRSKLRPYRLILCNWRNGVEDSGDLGLVGVSDDEGNAGESGDFFRGALGITAGYEDARGRIGRVDFADGIAGLGVSGGGNGAGVENHDVGSG